jgi:alpha-beta hydrolase superfamily lysophospholipase
VTAALFASLAVILAIQARAVAARHPGLHLLPRSTPRLVSLVLLAGAAALGWLAAQGTTDSVVLGIVAGIVIGLFIPGLRPLHPDAELARQARPLEVPGHPDAHALLLMPQGAPRALVVLAHGAGNDRSYALWHVAYRLVEQRFAVALFHMAGHGEGGNDLLEISAFRARLDAALAAARAAVPGPVVLVGQSLGGAAVLDAIARGVVVDAAFTVSAIARLELSWRLARELGIILHRASWATLRYATLMELVPAAGAFQRDRFPIRVAPGKGFYEVIAALLSELDLIARLKDARPAFPLTLFHGSSDGIVPVAQGRELAASLGDRARYIELPGVHHLDPMFDERVIAEIVKVVEARASPTAPLAQSGRP